MVSYSALYPQYLAQDLVFVSAQCGTAELVKTKQTIKGIPGLNSISVK